MRAFSRIISLVLAILLCLLRGLETYPEQGRWKIALNDLSLAGKAIAIRRSLFENSSIEVHISCDSAVELHVTYAITANPCANGFLGLIQEPKLDTISSKQYNTTIFPCKNHVEEDLFPPLRTLNEIYELELEIEKISENVSINVTVIMKSSHGYLSAMDWPLLPFYGTMCVIYALYGLCWMFFCFYYWREILRVQLWIGAVICLGLIEKAVFVAEYDSVNKTGESVRGAVIGAEIVSCFKRSLCRMLVIIVSLGFGIVKPTLGKTLHQISAVGIVYFTLCSTEAIIRTTSHKSQMSVGMLATLIPLAVTDSIICWWVFVAIVQTIRTLLVRRNLVKLSLYRQFRATLIFSVVVSVIFAIWSFRTFKSTACLSNWKLMWIDEAFWHMLFSSLLLVIMFLWRPSANNQRYAYSPLHDVDVDDDDDETTRESLADIKKVRGSRSSGSAGSQKTTQFDENLKWIDENIPSVLDRALPALLDDDHETLKRHQEEISKME